MARRGMWSESCVSGPPHHPEDTAGHGVLAGSPASCPPTGVSPPDPDGLGASAEESETGPPGTGPPRPTFQHPACVAGVFGFACNI